MRAIRHHNTKNPFSILVIAMPLALLAVYFILDIAFFLLPIM